MVIWSKTSTKKCHLMHWGIYTSPSEHNLMKIALESSLLLEQEYIKLIIIGSELEEIVDIIWNRKSIKIHPVIHIVTRALKCKTNNYCCLTRCLLNGITGRNTVCAQSHGRHAPPPLYEALKVYRSIRVYIIIYTSCERILCDKGTLLLACTIHFFTPVYIVSLHLCSV